VADRRHHDARREVSGLEFQDVPLDAGAGVRQRQRARDQHDEDDAEEGNDDAARALDAFPQTAQQDERAREHDGRRARHLQHQRPNCVASVGRQHSRGVDRSANAARDLADGVVQYPPDDVRVVACGRDDDREEEPADGFATWQARSLERADGSALRVPA